MAVEKVEYTKIEDGVRVVFTYDNDDNSVDAFELYDDDMDLAMPVLTSPGTPEMVMLAMRDILRFTVH